MMLQQLNLRKAFSAFKTHTCIISGVYGYVVVRCGVLRGVTFMYADRR